MLKKDWKEFIELLNANGVEYVLVGALAVAYHAIPRFTGDIDVLVRREGANVDRLLRALREFGFGSLGLKAEDFYEPGAFVQLGYHPNRIDILTEISGVSTEDAWETSVTTEMEGLPVRILGRECLIRNKRAVARNKDLADLDLLEGKGN